jgi:hypothetical protein
VRITRSRHANDFASDAIHLICKGEGGKVGGLKLSERGSEDINILSANTEADITEPERCCVRLG